MEEYNFAVSFNACLRQPDGQVWVVFNQALLDQTLSDGKDMIETIHMPFGYHLPDDACRRPGLQVHA